MHEKPGGLNNVTRYTYLMLPILNYLGVIQIKHSNFLNQLHHRHSKMEDLYVKRKKSSFGYICGVVFGLVCMFLASSNPNPTEPVTSSTRVLIIISRTLMGFTIGISALRMPWWLHGIAIGLIASIPMTIPVLSTIEIAIGTLVMGVLYGFLTELIISILFRTPSVGALDTA